jgi:hypothetical protein
MGRHLDAGFGGCAERVGSDAVDARRREGDLIAQLGHWGYFRRQMTPFDFGESLPTRLESPETPRLARVAGGRLAMISSESVRC